MKINIKQHYYRNGLIILHILFAILGFYTYFLNYRTSENLIIQKTLTKQAIIAKAGSLSVENLLKSVKNDLSSFTFSFAKIDESASIDKDNTRATFITYMQKAQLPINGIALYDESGKLIIIENRYDIRIGENQNFSQTAFIQWSKNPLNKEKIFISTPYKATTGASVGRTILIVVKPVYFGKIYKGTLTIRLLVSNFKDAFITPLISDTDEDTFIIDSNGVLIAGNNALLNNNLFAYAQKQKWGQSIDFMNKLRMIIKNNTVQTTWNFQNQNEKPRTAFVGSSKIDIPDTDKDLYFVVTTSRDNVISSLNPLRSHGLVWLGFGLLTTVVGGIIVVLLKSSG